LNLVFYIAILGSKNGPKLDLLASFYFRSDQHIEAGLEFSTD